MSELLYVRRFRKNFYSNLLTICLDTLTEYYKTSKYVISLCTFNLVPIGIEVDRHSIAYDQLQCQIITRYHYYVRTSKVSNKQTNTRSRYERIQKLPINIYANILFLFLRNKTRY